MNSRAVFCHHLTPCDDSGAFAATDGGSNWGAHRSRHACTHAGHIDPHQGPDSGAEHGRQQHIEIALFLGVGLSH
jgi:hypothetical protein